MTEESHSNVWSIDKNNEIQTHAVNQQILDGITCLRILQ